MTTEQYLQRLDTLAASKGTDRLLEAAELLRSNPSPPPLLISCRHVKGRIQHLFTSFDNPCGSGKKYKKCYRRKYAMKLKLEIFIPETHFSAL